MPQYPGEKQKASVPSGGPQHWMVAHGPELSDYFLFGSLRVSECFSPRLSPKPGPSETHRDCDPDGFSNPTCFSGLRFTLRLLGQQTIDQFGSKKTNEPNPRPHSILKKKNLDHQKKHQQASTTPPKPCLNLAREVLFDSPGSSARV